MRHSFPIFMLLSTWMLIILPCSWGQPLVQRGDLVYHGAFRLPPDTTGGSRFGYGGTALLFHPLHNSLFMVGHDWDQKVAEVSIPEPVISNDLEALHTSTMLQPFRDISEGLMYTVDDGTIKLGGLLLHGAQLVGSAWTYYDADASQIMSHFLSDTNIVETGDAEGMFQLGTNGAGMVAGYMTNLPEDWQSQFGGPAITGLCCIPIISRSSYGPAAFVFNPEDLGHTDPVPVTPLVYYPAEHPLSEWNSTGPLFNGTTTINGIIVPEGRRTVLFIGSHGIGEFCYGTGDYCNDPLNNYQGTHAYPYVYQIWAYDLLDLLEVRNGNLNPWEVAPYAVWNFDFPITDDNKSIGGAAYDKATGTIYISQQYIDGLDAFPLIHAFTLRGPHIYVDPTANGGLVNGTSWSNAFRFLQDALSIAHDGDTIHIAEGIYYPDDGVGHTTGNRAETFQFRDSIVVYGGYPSGGGTRNPLVHPVVLSGDLDHNDLSVPALMPGHLIGLNTYNVVICHDVVLDGLIISGGLANANDNSLHRSGAGLYCTNSVSLTDCTIMGNEASGNGTNGKGGGLFLESGTLTMRNVRISGNHATNTGSAFYATAGSVVVQENVLVQE